MMHRQIQTTRHPDFQLRVQNATQQIRDGIRRHINSMILSISLFTPENIKVNGIAVPNATPTTIIRHLVVRIATNTRNRKWMVNMVM